MKSITYHKTHSYKDKEGKEFSCLTKQYQIGVYGIVNNDSSLQFTQSPDGMRKLERKLKKEEEAGKIYDLSFSYPIKVVEVNGLWQQI